MEEKNGKPSELAEAMMQYLDCECRYFPPMRDDTELCAAYRDALRDAAEGGYVPMLIKVDEVLFECLIMNSDPDSDGEDDYRSDRDPGRSRSARLQAPKPCFPAPVPGGKTRARRATWYSAKRRTAPPSTS